MTHKKNGMLIICREIESKCENCGKIAEVRPYGANGERICFGCGMQDVKTTKRKFIEFMDKDTNAN